VAVAAAVFVAWYLATGDITTAAMPAIAVLVVAVSLKNKLATPTAILVGVGEGARRGVLIKGGSAFEKAGKIDMVVFDKTGTLTVGKPRVTDILVSPTFARDEILAIAASAETSSEHPLSVAVVESARAAGLSWPEASRFRAESGKGVVASVDGKKIEIGNAKLVPENGAFGEDIVKLESSGKTVIRVRIDGVLAGIMALADEVKPEAAMAVATLRKRGMGVAMITGDNERSARYMAQKLGIDDVVANVLPEGKAEAIKNMQNQKKTVAFVGDGVNDAPALAQADLGLAVGGGSDIALETGDVILVSGGPSKAAYAIELSKKTFKIIGQNLVWAFAYNIILIPVAALGWLNPMIAGGAMALSSVTVVMNALRIKSLTIKDQSPTMAYQHK
jgi:Cu+-exporting ATPase